jgi:outer membrane receptor for ferric coprogen and ferric-rhodotorulic acid
MLSIVSRSPLLLVFSAILVSTTFAQQSKPVLRGRIVDPNHASIPGADIWASANGLPSSSTVSDRNGEFSLTLEPGEYHIRVIAEGFSETTETVNLSSNSQPVEIVLPVAASSASVTITDAYGVSTINTATKTLTPLRDVPQSISVVTKEQIRDQSMSSVADVVTYVPGITSHQGENNRDQLVIRGNSTSADFFLNGVRDDVQYYRE